MHVEQLEDTGCGNGNWLGGKKVEQFKERINSYRENPSEITWDFRMLVGTEL